MAKEDSNVTEGTKLNCSDKLTCTIASKGDISSELNSMLSVIRVGTMCDSDHYIGEFGPYQRRQYFLICISTICSSFPGLVTVFITGTPDHRCTIPGYDNDTYAIQSDYHQYLINLTIPPPEDETETYSKCHMYNINISDSSTFNNRDTIPCKSWVYDRSVFLATFTDKVNLVCEDRIKTSHSQMIYFAGILVGSFALGLASDKIGRKITFMLSILFLFLSTIVLPWAPDFLTFCILRFLNGFFVLGLFMTGFVIVMELVGPSKRVISGIVTGYFWTLGLVILAGVAYGLRDWFYIQIVCSVPTILLLSYWWLIPESTRWLISKNRHHEAQIIINKTATVNKVDIPKNILNLQSLQKVPNEKVWQLFTSRGLLIRTLVIFLNWMVVSMVFYGLALNSGKLGGDFYLNFLLQAIVEIPAYTVCLIFLDKVGRKALHCSAMILGGLCCISTIFTVLYAENSLRPLTITLAMLGKIGATAAFSVIYIWSAELYPTVVRNSGMGLSSTCARVGGMVSPYVADLSKVIPGNFGRALPLVIFGVSSVVAGLLAILLPETMNTNLPETMEDGRQFGKGNSKCLKQKSKNQEEIGKISFISTTRL